MLLDLNFTNRIQLPRLCRSYWVQLQRNSKRIRYDSMLGLVHPACFGIGVQQNAIVRVLCGHLLAYLPPTGCLDGEVYSCTAQEGDFVDTCRWGNEIPDRVGDDGGPGRVWHHRRARARRLRAISAFELLRARRGVLVAGKSGSCPSHPQIGAEMRKER